MKRFLILAVCLILSLAAFAQEGSLQEVTDGLNEFTQALAPVMPLNSTIGTTWSDAYIGQLLDIPPHFGVGATAGITFVPSSFLPTLLTTMGVDSSAIPGFDTLVSLGVPMPAAAANARIGGFILPFDIGIKVGTLPPQVDLTTMIPNFDFSYMLVGADIRYALLQEKKNLVDLSVGLGLNYLSGEIGVSMDIPAVAYDFQAPSEADPSVMVPHTLGMTTPRLHMAWQAVSVDLSAQVSKRILFFTPYAGVGLTIGKPSAETGLKSSLTLDGAPVTAAEVEELMALFAAAGLPAPVSAESLTEGYVFTTEVTKGTDMRAYGGFSLDILMVRLDLNALYSFIGKNWGGSLGLRVQF